MVLTYKQKFNKKYGFAKDEPHSVADIARITGYKKRGLDTIVQKGRGAFFSAPKSVRPNIKDPTAWGVSGYILLSWEARLLGLMHLS